MKLKPFKRIPVLIALSVVALVYLTRLLNPDLVERLERITYDMRVRRAAKFPSVVATNLGFVFINEASVTFVRTNSALGMHFGLYWPRQIYGRLVGELADQGATAVGLDVIFKELRDDHPSVKMEDDSRMESDDFFALQLRRASNVVIAVNEDVTPPSLFATNALALGDITTETDADGILRQVQTFRVYTNWHAAFRQVAADPDLAVDLNQARVEPGQIVLRRPGGATNDIKIPLDKDGNFDVADFWGEKLPPGMARKAKPFTEERIWHMGIVLAAQELKLDLAHADVDLPHCRITLRGPAGVERVLPVDSQGRFFIDWCLPPNDPHLTQEPIQHLLSQSVARLGGQTNGLSDHWHGKLAIVGSSALVGHELTDLGSTPLSENTLFVSKHWNVANSIITGRFVRRSPLALDLALIVVLGGLAAFSTWKFRVSRAGALAVLLMMSYIFAATVIYGQSRYWLPLVLPLTGLLFEYVALTTWKVVFEQAEQRRVKSIFSKVVSPKIVRVLLQAENLSLVGARLEITVLFADIRGFTAFTDVSQERVAEYVRANNLSGASAEKSFDEQARETLNTVNLYLGLIADIIKKHDGTLDKFIGDCVMAFWGAPIANSKHAVACVRAAIEAQRAMYALNQQRAAENNRRQLENLARQSAGLPPKPILPILLLGTGINTGMATAGLMGSSEAESNYTVFGREVNLASRLESASGRGRIFIGETTYKQLLRDDPELAATCVLTVLKDVKGFRTAVNAYEVPWRPPGAPPFDEEFSTSAPADATTFTGFVQRGSS